MCAQKDSVVRPSTYRFNSPWRHASPDSYRISFILLRFPERPEWIYSAYTTTTSSFFFFFMSQDLRSHQFTNDISTVVRVKIHKFFLLGCKYVREWPSAYALHSRNPRDTSIVRKKSTWNTADTKAGHSCSFKNLLLLSKYNLPWTHSKYTILPHTVTAQGDLQISPKLPLVFICLSFSKQRNRNTG